MCAFVLQSMRVLLGAAISAKLRELIFLGVGLNRHLCDFAILAFYFSSECRAFKKRFNFCVNINKADHAGFSVTVKRYRHFVHISSLHGFQNPNLQLPTTIF